MTIKALSPNEVNKNASVDNFVAFINTHLTEQTRRSGKDAPKRIRLSGIDDLTLRAVMNLYRKQGWYCYFNFGNSEFVLCTDANQIEPREIQDIFAFREVGK